MEGARVRNERVIVEGFVDFDYEITLLTVRALDAEAAVQTQFCEPIGHVQVSGDYVEAIGMELAPALDLLAEAHAADRARVERRAEA